MAAHTAAIALDRTYELADRYRRADGPVYISGTQTLVRLMLAQAAADRAAGLKTAGLVSGYRGSPLGAVDLEFWRVGRQLAAADITFQPAINEDLAATIVAGSQKIGTDPARTTDGVFALWYGKGPGVDRAGDALRHGHAYGASALGGVLVVAGDDHGCASSSMSHQSDLALAAWRMPVVHPASIAEYVAFGLWGFAASRFSGAWVGFKAVSETVEATAAVAPAADVPTAPPAALPEDLHYRWPDLPSPRIEERLERKLEALRHFAKQNPLDRMVVQPAATRAVIVTVGKAHLDVLEAFRVCGIEHDDLSRAGIAIYKIGLVFPIETEGLSAAVAGADEIFVVEEKAAVVETQIRGFLYNAPADRRPKIIGKTDEEGRPLVPVVQETRPSLLAPLLAQRLARYGLAMTLPQAWMTTPEATPGAPVTRTPYFCSGCPHNRSTRVPEGSKAGAGIGCHFMANWMDRDVSGIVQMGGEGVDWIGQAPFTHTTHMFQNLGDGTYFHSGHMAVRQAIAAKVNVTYKILFNDAVAMTGGQPVDGTMSVAQITRLVAAEGAARVVVVSDEPDKYPPDAGFEAGTTIHHRDDLDAVQRDLRATPGVTVLIYDQTCAAEKRRRRKKKTYPDPARRVVINERVCEGCGDCQKKSNCLSIVPLDTEFGTKRTIDQSSCNKDFSCVEGFCPSFVTVEGGALKRATAARVDAAVLAARIAGLPVPERVACPDPFEILVAGVGGTGIVTVGALIVMAAHLEGKAASVLDFTGFAQKGGPVLSHVRLCDAQSRLHQVRIDKGRADTVLAADLVVGASADVLNVVDARRTRIVANTHEQPTGAMLRDATARVDTRLLETLVRTHVDAGDYSSFDAQRLSERLLGDAAQTNILLLGYAWQKGLVPLSMDALDRAVELNGVAVERNRVAFAWGRLAAGDMAFVAQVLGDTSAAAPQTLDELIVHRTGVLRDYQDAAYAETYRAFVEHVRATEAAALPGSRDVTEAVAKNLFKLMAYKDEYEVARLFADGAFAKKVDATFEGPVRLVFHLAPPLLARTRPNETEPRKMTFGPWMMRAYGLLAKFKRLRGTPLDVFGYTHERRMERRLVGDYRALIEASLLKLTADKRDIVLQLAALPADVRGYGPIKMRAVAEMDRRRTALVAALDAEPRASEQTADGGKTMQDEMVVS